MVWQGIAPCQLQPLGAQHGKKFVRVSDGGECLHGALAQICERHVTTILRDGVGRQLPLNGPCCCTALGHFSGWLAAVKDDIELARPGLAQRASGQWPTIAHAHGIENGNFYIARQCQVLQAVVTHQHIGSGVSGQSGAGGLGALLGHKYGRARALCNQQGLVAHLLGMAAGRDFDGCIRACSVAPVPARDDGGPPAHGLQGAYQMDSDRGFACTTCNHIAHDHDGHRH